jgi:hypothetical protein
VCLGFDRSLREARLPESDVGPEEFGGQKSGTFPPSHGQIFVARHDLVARHAEIHVDAHLSNEVTVDAG